MTQQPSTTATPNTMLGVVLTVYLMILLDLSIAYTGMPEIGRTIALSVLAILLVVGFILPAARKTDNAYPAQGLVARSE